MVKSWLFAISYGPPKVALPFQFFIRLCAYSVSSVSLW